MIRPGEPWGHQESSAPEAVVRGGDAALAGAVAAMPGSLVRFAPDATSDLAGAVGLVAGEAGEPAGIALELDALRLADGTLVCNMCVLGSPPDRLGWAAPWHEIEVRLDGAPWFAGRATTVVIANGQFLRGRDVVPRGHPGDARAEVQVYELRRAERRSMRARLGSGAHVPHPRIRQRSARQVEVHSRRPLSCEADRLGLPAVGHLAAEVLPGAYRLLV